MLSKDTKFAIIGLGLLGGSYAMGLSKAGYQVYGVDINEDSCKFAEENGYCVAAGNDPSLVKDADIVISALYPHAFISWVKQYQNLLKSGCILNDVTGVKVTVIDEINSFLRSDVEFVAAHPMAGREVSGIRNANPDIFKKANFVIVPTENNRSESIDKIKDIATILQFGHIGYLSASEHDEMIAFLSQLTHMIAVSLMNTNDNPDFAVYTGDSFRDLTRIAKINENMWAELFLMNKEALLKEADNFMAVFNHFKEALVNDDVDEMKRLFVQSTERRMKFEKR